MLLCLTANHRNASFDLLEKLSGGAPGAVGDLVSASGAGDLAGATTATHSVLAGAVVLATCNRFEAYLDVREDGADGSRNAVDAVLGAISSASAVDGVELRESVTVISHDDVVAHLFAVSSGLESVVIGEDEISGQVRRALEQARSAGTTTRGLEQLFQRASAASRQVKTTTAVGTAGRSLVRLALELASSRIIDWSETRVVMVGTGAYAGAALAALRDRGATDVTVFSPSGRAEKFAIGHGIRFTTDLAASIGESDVILTCTTAEGHVITPDLVDIGRRLLVIDLGLPRNVDPAVSQLENIGLLDLETISLHAPLEELNATSDARSIVGRAAREFAAAEAELTVAPAVVALRRHVTGILEAEIERARSRGDSSAQTEQALRHLAGVLMHTPSVRARELARVGEGADFSTAVATLFGLETAAAGDARADDEAAAS